MVAIGRLTEDRRGRIFDASAEIRDASGTILASATGKYRPVKEDAAAVLAEDFVGDSPDFLMGDKAT